MKFKKNKKKTAVRVLDTLEEAEAYKDNLQEKSDKDNYWIEERPGTDTRCIDYCNCHDFCPYYKQKYKIKEEG